MKKRKKAYALIIGVGKDLPVTENDAKSLAKVIGKKKYGNYLDENITLLTGKKATRKGILEAFDTLLKTVDEDSSVLLFYSGHGGTYSENTFIKDEALRKPEEENQKFFHLCPFDYDPVNFKDTWIKAEEVKSLLEQLKTRRLIFFLDCCHAAGITLGASVAAGEQPRLTNADGLAQKIDDGRGMSIVSACRADQLSFILEGEENSVFTKCLLEVLKGEHKNELDDPFVRILEVVQHILKRVPQEVEDQNPFSNIQIFDDFIVSFASFPGAEDKKKDRAKKKKNKSKGRVPVTKFRETDASNSAIVFVHGFSGDAENTFAKAPHLLMDTQEMNGWDMFPMGYSGNIIPELGKNIWACASDIKRNSDYLLTSIKNKFSKYKRIAIVAHDIGGIVAQQTLLQLEKTDLNRISHVLFFATPSNGIPEVDLKNFFVYDNEEKELKQGSPYMGRLRDGWDQKFNHDYPFTFKTIAATKDEYVPITSSLDPFPKEFQEIIEADHFSLVQIDDVNDDSYQLLLNTLMGKSFLNTFSNKEEVNIALGEYNAVIRALLPNLDALDRRGLERLTYALEASGREEEAKDILENHPLAQENAKLVEILAGRYKRQYINTSIAEDLKMAFKHYQKALKICEEKQDHAQIYKITINLAFLSLLDDDKQAMIAFANQAFEATEKDPFPSLWKWATLGDIYLYKGDFDNAKEHYVKAAKMADLRQKIAIHSNAYKAYISLMQTDHPKDPFLVFLKAQFLT